jgi:hypothetical protein
MLGAEEEMADPDQVREALREKGLPPPVVDAGLDGLLVRYEAFVSAVERGYRRDLEQYLADLEPRQLLLEVYPLARPPLRARVDGRIAEADQRLRAQVVPTRHCIAGAAMAAQSGWNAQASWWYFHRPRNPGSPLQADLARMKLL